jgi:hypothetical protein
VWLPSRPAIGACVLHTCRSARALSRGGATARRPLQQVERDISEKSKEAANTRRPLRPK